MTTPTDSAAEVLRDRLLKAVSRAEDWAGSMPAKEAVKLRPSDWHAVCDLAREAANSLTAAATAGQNTDPVRVAVPTHGGTEGSGAIQGVAAPVPGPSDEVTSVTADRLAYLNAALAREIDRATTAEAALAALQAEAERLRGFITQLADEIEAEANARWPEPARSVYPSYQRGYNRDISTALEARAALQAEGGRDAG